MPLLKKHIRLGHTGIVDDSIDLSIPDSKKVLKKKEGMDRNNRKFLKIYEYVTANTSAIWQHAARTTDQLSSPNR